MSFECRDKKYKVINTFFIGGNEIEKMYIVEISISHNDGSKLYFNFDSFSRLVKTYDESFEFGHEEDWDFMYTFNSHRETLFIVIN